MARSRWAGNETPSVPLRSARPCCHLISTRSSQDPKEATTGLKEKVSEFGAPTRLSLCLTPAGPLVGKSLGRTRLRALRALDEPVTGGGHAGHGTNNTRWKTPSSGVRRESVLANLGVLY